MEHKIIRKAWIANLLAIALPWLLVIPFSTGSGFDNIIEFGGSIFIGITCFVAPPILFICALRPKFIFKDTTHRADVEENVKHDEMTDTQFPEICDERRVGALSIGSFAILGILLAALIYSWYVSA
jgi:hypothetical protein